MEILYTHSGGYDSGKDVVDVREGNAMGVVLEGVDGVKLGYLTSAMTLPKTSDKLTYPTWLIFLDERKSN